MTRTGGERSVKPSAQPTLVRTRHFPPLPAPRSCAIKITLAAATQRHKPRRRCSVGTSLPIPGCLVSVPHRDPALRSLTSTSAPEQLVLDGRSHPDSHRPGIPNGGYRLPRDWRAVTICSEPPVSGVVGIAAAGIRVDVPREDKKASARAGIVLVPPSHSGMIFPVVAHPQQMYRITCPSRAPGGGPPLASSLAGARVVPDNRPLPGGFTGRLFLREAERQLARTSPQVGPSGALAWANERCSGAA
jgi:hypothetical protein